MGVARYLRNKKDSIEDVIYQSGIHVKSLYNQNDLYAVGVDNH